MDDFNVVLEIAYHEELGRPLNLKQLFLLGAAPASTVQRRLRRLKRLGVIEQRRSRDDRRAVEIKLSAKFRKIYGEYGAMMVAGGHASVRKRRARRRLPGDDAPAELSYVYPKALRRAAALVGGPHALAQRLGVPPARLDHWLKGDGTPPLELFLECVDIALTAMNT